MPGTTLRPAIQPQQRQRAFGFTLIELLIAVAVVAILAAIAYPTYQDQVRKAHRADAKAALLELAQFLERNYTETGRYDRDGAGNPIALPYTEAPKDGAGKYYDLTLTAVARNAFTLTATAKGAQAADTKCASFTLTNAGTKSATGTDAAHCW